jgi:hypothetical protein
MHTRVCMHVHVYVYAYVHACMHRGKKARVHEGWLEACTNFHTYFMQICLLQM